MRARNADVWIGGLLLAITLAFAGHSLGEALADSGHEAPAWPSGARWSDVSLDGWGSRWMPTVGGVATPMSDAPQGAEA